MPRLHVETTPGPAWVDLDRPAGSVSALLMLGHGAGGGVDAPDLLAVTAALTAAGVAVARVTQPYRVAGKRAPVAAPRLDLAWLEIANALRDEPGLGAPALILGGRSSGARVACRTAAELTAAAVIALAFPVHPPGRPEKSRLFELDLVPVPTLVVQGDRDAFGMPPPASAPVRRELVVIAGADHSLRRDPASVAAAALRFLLDLGLARPSANGDH